MKKFALAVVGVGMLAASMASAESYVLQASKWSKAQSAAVEAAGGTVVFGHGKSGLGLATSDAADFAQRAAASGAFQSVKVDQVVQWQQPIPEENVINASNDTFYPIQWAHIAIESPAAWAAGCSGDGVRVAVLDGGIYAAHVDLAANVDTACSTSFVPSQAFNTDTGTFWHGTHVAGIVAAVDNSTGVIGVAPDATIMGVKVLHSGSGSFGAVIGGILYASDPPSFGAPGCARADIINMSLGAVFAKSEAGGGSLVAALNKAVNFAGSQGVLVISSAGNNGADLGQSGNFVVVPAQSGSGVAVSATGPVGWAYGETNFDRIASYSNYGEDLVFVAAPGGDFVYPTNENCTMPIVGGTITRACWVFDLYFSTIRGTTANGGYGWAAGTSMAAPATSGVAALILGANPGISLGNLKARLAAATTDSGKVGHDEFYGHGFVNARLACTN